MATKHDTTFPAQRVSIKTPIPYATVHNRLTESITPHGAVSSEQVGALVREGKAAFVSFFESHVGPQGFVQFASFNHGAWIRLFGVGDGLQLERFILGNPLVAITMIERDLDAGLFVPVELLLRELPEGKGTEVVYILPSSLITAVDKDEKLIEAAKKLDGKLKVLVKDITAIDDEKAQRLPGGVL